MHEAAGQRKGGFDGWVHGRGMLVRALRKKYKKRHAYVVYTPNVVHVN